MDSKSDPKGYGVQFAWLSIVATLAVVTAIGCPVYRLTFASDTFPCRITPEAEVDGRPVVGSGVIQETVRRRGQPVAVGEAVRLDLGQIRELFLLFPGYRGTPHALINLPFETFPDGAAEPLERVKKLLHDRPRAEIPLATRNIPGSAISHSSGERRSGRAPLRTARRHRVLPSPVRPRSAGPCRARSRSILRQIA